MKIFVRLFEFVGSRKKAILIAGLFLVIAIGIYLRKIGLLDAEKMIAGLENYPVAAPFIYLIVYALMVVFLIPTLPMNIGAGFLWGTFWGGVLTLFSAVLGASAAFFVSRYLAHDYFEKKFENGRTWKWLQREILEQGWKAVAFTRANPAFPFGLSSYFFGLTKLPFLSYFWGTAGFVMPPAFIFSVLGDFIGAVVLSKEISSILSKIFIVGFLAAIIVILRFAVKWHKHIAA